jgi:hypothetical protein
LGFVVISETFMAYEKYLDLPGDGGIEGFIILPNAIIILFDNGFWYIYSYSRPGKEHVEQMKRLAKKGKGLKTYINKNVRDNYEGKSDNPPLAA